MMKVVCHNLLIITYQLSHLLLSAKGPRTTFRHPTNDIDLLSSYLIKQNYIIDYSINFFASAELRAVANCLFDTQCIAPPSPITKPESDRDLNRSRSSCWFVGFGTEVSWGPQLASVSGRMVEGGMELYESWSMGRFATGEPNSHLICTFDVAKNIFNSCNVWWCCTVHIVR